MYLCIYIHKYIYICIQFVGTPEYLSPSTVNSEYCGVEVDLWALGIVLFQMLLGYTPFGSPSPYLTFLRIKRCDLRVRL